MLLQNAKWISYPEYRENEYPCPVFRKRFSAYGEVARATLKITSLGCYYAELGGKRIGDFIFAPGWTFYGRTQMQRYDITRRIQKENEFRVTLGNGWFKGRINPRNQADLPEVAPALLCEIEIVYRSGEREYIRSDESWECALGKVVFSDFYDGERYDANAEERFQPVEVQDCSFVAVIRQQGERVCERETLSPQKIFTTPNGETVIDFGQNLTGYFEIALCAKEGDRVAFSVAETLDKDGNFYNENYRSAKAAFEYICKDGYQTYKPRLAFWGFRYIRVEEFPVMLTKESVKAIVVHSRLKRTGFLSSSSSLLNRLFDNILWGQKGNFLDIPTDCPQRDERLGWTGDAQVFVRTASYQYDVEKFFTKWLTDLWLEQKRQDGIVPYVVPQTHPRNKSISASWGDAAVICPWQIYLTYGNKRILRRQFPSMRAYVDSIGRATKKEYLWFGCWHYGDWLGLDAPAGSYVGSSNRDFIATAYYANAAKIVAKAGKLLGKKVDQYERLYQKIVETAKKEFTQFNTQTECAVALYFGLTDDRKKTAETLARLVEQNGKRLQTGFVGTPYLLHALSENGYTELAYDLLLQEEYPSWLYSVKQGATTIWEHWDGVNERGEFWSSDMNSFNHYAYGSVADWVYGVACGIKTVEEKPGFEEVVIAPQPTKKLDGLCARLLTRHGEILSSWKKEGNGFRYEITTPVRAKLVIEGKEYEVEKGSYSFNEFSR